MRVSSPPRIGVRPMSPIISALIAGTLTIAVADPVPNINIQPSCRAAAAGAAGLKQDLDTCLQSEQKVRSQLAEQWGQFRADDRTSCSRLTTMAGGGTYTELLTCLEMKRDARRLSN